MFPYKYLKPVALFLVIESLFQCYIAYDKRPAWIEKAINVNHKKVKRIKIDRIVNKQYVFDPVYFMKVKLNYRSF